MRPHKVLPSNKEEGIVFILPRKEDENVTPELSGESPFWLFSHPWGRLLTQGSSKLESLNRYGSEVIKKLMSFVKGRDYNQGGLQRYLPKENVIQH